MTVKNRVPVLRSQSFWQSPNLNSVRTKFLNPTKSNPVRPICIILNLYVGHTPEQDSVRLNSMPSIFWLLWGCLWGHDSPISAQTVATWIGSKMVPSVSTHKVISARILCPGCWVQVSDLLCKTYKEGADLHVYWWERPLYNSPQFSWLHFTQSRSLTWW